MNPPTPNRRAYTFGELCAINRRMPKEIRNALSALGIVPSWVLNHRDCYSEDDIERIAEFFKRAEQSAIDQRTTIH